MSRKQTKPPKRLPHTPIPLKSIGRLWCWRCGLVYCHNEATARAIKAPCPGQENDG